MKKQLLILLVTVSWANSYCTSTSAMRGNDLFLVDRAKDFPDAEIDFDSTILDKKSQNAATFVLLKNKEDEVLKLIINDKDKLIFLEAQKNWAIYYLEEAALLQKLAPKTKKGEIVYEEAHDYLLQERLCELDRYLKILDENTKQLALPEPTHC